MKKLEKNFNWKFDVKKLIIVWKIGVKFESRKIKKKKNIIDEEIIRWKIDMKKILKTATP